MDEFILGKSESNGAGKKGDSGRGSQTSKGSEEFFRSPSIVGQEVKKEEEEEEEEEDPRNIWVKLFFPDWSPLGSLLIVLVSVAISITYLKKIGFERPFIYPLFVLFLDVFTYILIMCFRYVVSVFTLTRFGEGRFFAAVSGSLDPELVYCIWTSVCLAFVMGDMEKQIIGGLVDENSQYHTSRWFNTVLSSLKIPKVPWDIIQCAHISLVIISLRRLLLSVITFYFRLDFIMSMNPQISQFLRLYSLLRKIDTKWYLIKPHIRKKGLLFYPTEADFSNNSYKLSEDNNRITTTNLPNVPSMLLDSNIDYTAKSSSENWLALQFIKQYNVSVYIDDEKYEIRTKQQARDFAKLIFFDILEHLHSIMLYHYIGRTDHIKPYKEVPPRSDTYSMIGDDTFCHALIDFEEKHDLNKVDTLSNNSKSSASRSFTSNNCYNHSLESNKTMNNNIDTDNANDDSNQNNSTNDKKTNKSISLPTTLPNSVLDILYDKPLGDLIKQIDTARRGQITEEEWVRFCVGIYDSRKKILRAASSQEGIVQVFRRMISIFSWFFTGIMILLMVGINVDTLIISGAAIISSLSVGLSYIYSNFFSAVIFVIFLNPYNVGDRIRVNNGGALIVKKIETFYTEFNTVFEAPVLIPHSWLSSQMIYNESRSKCCSSEIQFLISDTTSPFSIEALATAVREYISVRPSEFVASNFWCGINAIQPGHSATVYMWITNTDPFHNRRKLLVSKSKLLLFILHTLRQLGIQYTLPISRVRIENEIYQHHSMTQNSNGS